MGILSNTYESELDVHILVEDVESMRKFHKQCGFIFDNKWSTEAILTRHLSDELAALTNQKILEQLKQVELETFMQMSIPASLFECR